MSAGRVWSAVAILALAAVVGIPPAPAQIDDEDEREREQAKDREIRRRLPPWLYDQYKTERDRDTPTVKTELDTLVGRARLFPLIGREPPPFSLLRLDGRRVALSDFTGHVVLRLPRPVPPDGLRHRPRHEARRPRRGHPRLGRRSGEGPPRLPHEGGGPLASRRRAPSTSSTPTS